MGGKCPHRKVKKRRFSHKSARRSKFLLNGEDMVYDALNEAKEGTSKPLPVDEDLPGMGQFYCLHCDRYFANVSVRDDHFRTKLHKKRAKQMNKVFEADDAQIPRLKRRREELPPHTQLDADLAAGMGMPDNGPKLGFT